MQICLTCGKKFIRHDYFERHIKGHQSVEEAKAEGTQPVVPPVSKPVEPAVEEPKAEEPTPEAEKEPVVAPEPAPTPEVVATPAPEPVPEVIPVSEPVPPPEPPRPISLHFSRYIEVTINGRQYFGKNVDAPDMDTASEIVRIAREAYGSQVLISG